MGIGKVQANTKPMGMSSKNSPLRVNSGESVVDRREFLACE
jgi:hypothetical protein